MKRAELADDWEDEEDEADELERKRIPLKVVGTLV